MSELVMNIMILSEISGKVNEYRPELINAGVISLSNNECKDLVEKFVGFDKPHESLDNEECKKLVENFMGNDVTHETLENEECKKLLENFVVSGTDHETLDNDMTSSWKPIFI